MNILSQTQPLTAPSNRRHFLDLSFSPSRPFTKLDAEVILLAAENVHNGRDLFRRIFEIIHRGNVQRLWRISVSEQQIISP